MREYKYIQLFGSDKCSICVVGIDARYEFTQNFKNHKGDWSFNIPYNGSFRGVNYEGYKAVLSSNWDNSSYSRGRYIAY